MNISDYTSSGPGRPRSRKSHRAILEATRKLLISKGVHGLSIEGVAAEAAVGKATIYRHWQSKEALISEAIGSIANDVDIPNSGDSMRDLTVVLNGMVKLAHAMTNSNLHAMKRMLAGLMDTPALMAVYKEQFILPRRQALIEIIEKGIERGEFLQSIDVETTIDMIIGSYFYHVFIKDTLIRPDEWIEKIKPILLNGIGPKSE